MNRKHPDHKAAKPSDWQLPNEGLRILARVIVRRLLDSNRGPAAENHCDLADHRDERTAPFHHLGKG